MEHIVVLIGQLVYFSALHPLQLTIDDRDKTMRMERMGVAGSNVDGGSVLPPFVQGSRSGTRLACRRCIEALQLVLLVHLQTKKRYAVDTINCHRRQ